MRNAEVVPNPGIKQTGIKFHPTKIITSTEKAIGFEKNTESSIVWLPKSQIHLERDSNNNLILWVRGWMVEKGEVDHLKEDH